MVISILLFTLTPQIKVKKQTHYIIPYTPEAITATTIAITTTIIITTL